MRSEFAALPDPAHEAIVAGAAVKSDVTIVVPTFNRARMLAECLDSLQRQTQPALEIIVVDDGSTDDTAAVVKGRSGSIRYIHQANAGKSAALNRALPHIRGHLGLVF